MGYGEHTPSNVSTSASSRKNVRLSKFDIVELSLKTRRIDDNAARGPFTTASTAAWGKYVKTNMNVVTPMLVVNICASLDCNGFHRLRCETK